MVGKVPDIKNLVEKSPDELIGLARVIVKDYASAQALNTTLYHAEKQADEVKAHIVGMVSDLLHYAILKHAIKYGDIGMMEVLPPYLLLRFTGGRN